MKINLNTKILCCIYYIFPFACSRRNFDIIVSKWSNDVDNDDDDHDE